MLSNKSYIQQKPHRSQRTIHKIIATVKSQKKVPQQILKMCLNNTKLETGHNNNNKNGNAPWNTTSWINNYEKKKHTHNKNFLLSVFVFAKGSTANEQNKNAGRWQKGAITFGNGR